MNKTFSDRIRRFPTRTLVFTALMTALVTAATIVLGFRTGDFFFNCGDAVIFITAALFGPVPAMLAGGIGSFFADLAVYPATMFFTLFIKGAEGLVCGLIMYAFRGVRNKYASAAAGVLAMIVAGVLMMTSYFICNSYLYGTPASALAALPADAVQASASVGLATVVLYVMRLVNLKSKLRLSVSTGTASKLSDETYSRTCNSVSDDLTDSENVINEQNATKDENTEKR